MPLDQLPGVLGGDYEARIQHWRGFQTFCRADYVIQLDDTVTVSRDTFIERMFEQRIGCSVHYIPLHLQPYWRDTYGLLPSMFPVSQRIFERSVSLPIYPGMTEADVTRVVDAIKAALNC